MSTLNVEAGCAYGSHKVACMLSYMCCQVCYCCITLMSVEPCLQTGRCGMQAAAAVAAQEHNQAPHVVIHDSDEDDMELG
jgi:hypothetical protein